MRIRPFVILLIGTLALVVPYAGPHTLTRSRAQAQSAVRHFPETGFTVGGRFLQYWQEHGGLAQQGYPISEEMQEKSETDGKVYTVQYFERAVFELHPENSPPHDVLLSLLGTFEYKRKYGEAGASGQRPGTDNRRFFPETGKTMGGVFRAYWENHGGLAQQGYPISDEFEERSELDGKTYTVQYFQRAVFELHPENAGTPYEVLLSQLGKFRYNRRHGGAPVSPGETPVPAASVPAEAASWLREHAVPLRTAEPSDDYSDLLPLKELIGDARIVALGEATHGSREFFTMKHRILRFLVQEMGFTVLAFEDGWPEALSVDEYVLGGPGSPEDAVRDLLYWPWETREVVEMVEWMRAYNASRGEAPAIRFHGFDVQIPDAALTGVIAYLSRVDGPAAERARARYACFAAYSGYYRQSEQAKSNCRAGLQQVHDEMLANRNAYEGASSAQAFAAALFSARVVLQAEEMHREPDRWDIRDRYMAENVGALLEQGGPDTKVIVWAHNGHVGTVREPGHDYDSMGMHLRAKYGDALRVIGFSFYRGEFNALGRSGAGVGAMTVFGIVSSPEGSYGHYFHGTGLPQFLLDLRGIRAGSAATDWLIGPRALWSIGSAYSSSAQAAFQIPLTRAFDAIIHIDMVRATALLPPERRP